MASTEPGQPYPAVGARPLGSGAVGFPSERPRPGPPPGSLSTPSCDTERTPRTVALLHLPAGYAAKGHAEKAYGESEDRNESQSSCTETPALVTAPPAPFSPGTLL